jgi:hypothetical protein
MDPDEMALPKHLQQEAQRLVTAASTDNPITDVQGRPLVKSSAVWLMRNGTINKEDSPGVIQKAGILLHNIIPRHFLQEHKGKGGAITRNDFEQRIFTFLQNHVSRTSRDFLLLVPHDEVLTTPMRSLEQAGLVSRVGEGEHPPQGHSGKSIMGRKPGAPVPEALPAPDLGAPDPDPAAADLADLDARAPAPAPAPAPGEGASGKRPAVSKTRLDAAHVIDAFARHHGLDIKIAPAARSGAELPTATTGTGKGGSTGTGKGGSTGTGKGGSTGTGKGRTSGRQTQLVGQGARTAAAPAHQADPPPVTREAEAEARPHSDPPDGYVVRSSATSDVPPKKRPKARAQPPRFVPSRPWTESSPQGDWVVTTAEPHVGQKVAFYFELPQDKGGTDWYVGTIQRLSRPHWADVDYPDGKLWCAVKESERGDRWVALGEHPTPSRGRGGGRGRGPLCVRGRGAGGGRGTIETGRPLWTAGDGTPGAEVPAESVRGVL